MLRGALGVTDDAHVRGVRGGARVKEQRSFTRCERHTGGFGEAELNVRASGKQRDGSPKKKKKERKLLLRVHGSSRFKYLPA